MFRPVACWITLLALWSTTAAPAQESRPASPDAEIEAALARVSKDRIEANVRKLVGFGTRHAMSSWSDPDRGVGAAARWIQGEFEAIARTSNGRMKVRLQEFDPKTLKNAARFLPEWWKEGLMRNVVAELAGDDPTRILVVSGHYDSRVGERFDATSDAPGANDDASGTAVVLEAARALAPLKMRATIWFAALTAEELQLWGSQALAREADQNGSGIEAVLNNDIVGGARNGEKGVAKDLIRLFSEGRPRADAESHARVKAWAAGESESDSPSREWARFVKRTASRRVPDAEVRLVFRLDRYLRGGDHRSFNEFGFAAARLTEQAENYDRQHQNVREENGVRYGDHPEYVDYAYAAKVAQVNVAALAAAALAPAPPTGVRIDTTKLMNQTRLVWKPSDDPEIVDYRVRMRLTHEPDWTADRLIGKSGAVVLEESKDDWLFAVEAVGKNGLPSIPVFPTANLRR